MAQRKDTRGIIRLVALGIVLVLGGYWLGNRYGERPPQKVEAVPAPASFAEGKSEGLIGDEAIYVKIYSQAAPAVANIETRTVGYDEFWMEPVPVEGAGSGFVIDPRGYVLTNFHVVQ